MKIKISNDVYNISNRIKNIEKNYYILFNTSTNKFEVHNSSQKDSSYCLTLPYNFLDERTLNYINLTKSENLNKILDKIEYQNKLFESEQKTLALNQFADSIEQELKKE